MVCFNCLDTFCEALSSSIQWKKTSYFRQSPLDMHMWLTQFQWNYICLREVFKLFGISFAFQGSPAQLWNFVVQKVQKKLNYWMTKNLSLVGKFQIYSIMLASTHIYYSSCSDPSLNYYKNIDKLLQDFIWASNLDRKDFH